MVVIKTRYQFDRMKLVEAVGRAKASALMKIGAFIMRFAQWSMHRRSGPSSPGSPPNVHQGQLRDLIIFAADGASGAVAVGPKPFARVEAPRLNEFGGYAPALATRSLVRNSRYYPARPFMRPAREDSMTHPKLQEAWANTIRP